MQPVMKNNNRYHEKDYVLARQMAEQAQVCINPAEAKGRAAKTQPMSSEVRVSISVLHNDINRNSR